MSVGGQNTGGSNPKVTSKGDRHGKPRTPTKAGLLNNPLPTRIEPKSGGIKVTGRVK